MWYPQILQALSDLKNSQKGSQLYVCGVINYMVKQNTSDMSTCIVVRIIVTIKNRIV